MQLPFITLIDFLATSIFLYLLLAFRDYRRRRGLPYPPGPPSRPIIGNLFDVPKESPWTKYADISNNYGDIFCLRIFGQVIVVLNSLSAIKDLLEKRGDVYADRPMLSIMEILELDWLLPISRKSKSWREGRRLLDRSLRPGGTTSYRHMMEEKTRTFLAKLLDTPKHFRDHIELLQGRLVMSLTYGYDLKDNDDIITAPVQATEIMSQLILPGAALVNHLPFLRHIPSWTPWFSYEPLARIGRNLAQRMKNEPIDFVKNAMHEGTAIPSLASKYLQEIEYLNLPERQRQEEIIKRTLGSIFGAGSDTTVSSMTSLFLALVLYPEVKKKAQAELDSLLGRDRLPTFGDRPHLPYIDAMCKELMRWQLVTPMGIPHASTEDDVYRGFFIPKGSIMVANAWAILHDPESYPDPEAFKPERFLNEDGTVRDDPAISLAFGVGKRICPGRHFVDATLFIVASSVVSVFDVTKAKDENGHEIPVDVVMSIRSGIVIQPEEFSCCIVPRDKHAEELIVANALP
ncbi:cytochrome P450 [Lactifluus subvellereus]|nr:cytochrome P450 [Lactifluus subvellereus]